MKGFNKEVEHCMTYSLKFISSVLPRHFEEFTVEPVPDISDPPEEFYTREFLVAIMDHEEYHMDRIEREAGGE